MSGDEDGIRRVRPGPRKSEAVVCGGLVFLAGQVCADPAGKDTEQQTRWILTEIDAILAESGTDKRRVVSSTVWLRDVGEIEAMNRAWEAWVAPGASPARATVEARLGGPDYRVEIALVAAL